MILPNHKNNSAVILVLLISNTAFAQVYSGFTAGYQSVSFHNAQGISRWSGGRGIRAGALVDYPFRKSKFGARLEAAYSFIHADDNAANDKLNLNYLSLPVSFFYMPHPQVQLFVGPQLNMLLHQSDSQGQIEVFDKIDGGIHASMEFFFLRNTSVAIRYYRGMKYNTNADLNKLNAIQLCLNYFLFKTKSG